MNAYCLPSLVLRRSGGGGGGGGRGEERERLVHTVLRMRLISTISRENRIFQ